MIIGGVFNANEAEMKRHNLTLEKLSKAKEIFKRGKLREKE